MCAAWSCVASLFKGSMLSEQSVMTVKQAVTMTRIRSRRLEYKQVQMVELLPLSETGLCPHEPNKVLYVY